MRIVLPKKLEDHVRIPFKRAVVEQNPLFETTWDLPVDETNWMTPLMTSDSINLNQDFAAFGNVFSNSNPHFKRAKTFMDSYIKMGRGDEDTLSLLEAYKSIYDSERSLNAKNRDKAAIDLGNVLKEECEFTHRIHRFMAVAVSYLINQYNHDVGVGIAGSFEASNMFDVLSYERYEREGRAEPLDDDQVFTKIMKKNRVCWLYHPKKLKKQSIEIFEADDQGQIWQRLMRQENRFFLLSMYRYSVTYYEHLPYLFTETMENMCLFWQLYAEMKGKMVTVTDLGLTKWFAPFEFDVPLISYLSHKTDGRPSRHKMLYSTQKLANCPLGVESFYCFCYHSTISDKKETLVFIPYVMKVSLKALKTIKSVDEEDWNEPSIFIRKVIGQEFEIPE